MLKQPLLNDLEAYLACIPLFVLVYKLDDLRDVPHVVFKLLASSFRIVTLGAFSLLLRSVNLSSEVMGSDFKRLDYLLESKQRLRKERLRYFTL